jgi:hypothetical protein
VKAQKHQNKNKLGAGALGAIGVTQVLVVTTVLEEAMADMAIEGDLEVYLTITAEVLLIRLNNIYPRERTRLPHRSKRRTAHLPRRKVSPQMNKLAMSHLRDVLNVEDAESTAVVQVDAVVDRTNLLVDHGVATEAFHSVEALGVSPVRSSTRI